MRFGLVAVFVVAALTLVGRNAEAQARGTLQATATVVDTHQGFQALTTSKPSAIVVTVDFSRN